MKTLFSKISTFFLILIAFTPTISFSQNSKTWEWADNIVATNKNYPYSLYTDKEGNNYVAGSFSDTLKVGRTILISRGSFDIYLLKYNAKGNLVWAKQYGGKDSDEAYAISSDGSGNIYLTGYFSGTADFSGTNFSSNGDRDFFVAKVTQNGDMVWVKQGGGTSEDYGTAIAADRSGNVIITGIFKGAMTLGNTNYVSKGDKDIFLIKYGPNGEIIWSVTAGGSLSDESTSLAIDQNGNCYVGGDFEGMVDFSKNMIVSTGKKDVFLAKYNGNGIIQWLKREGSATGDDHASAIAFDNSDNIYLTGYFSGLGLFGKTNLKSMGSDDIFLVKFDPNGSEIWAKQTGGKGDEHARAMKLDKSGNIYLCGDFNVDFTFGKSNIHNGGDWDIFIIKYGPQGEMLSGTQLSGLGYDRGYGIGLDGNSDIYITGFFSRAIGIGTTNLISIDADDGFIAKLKGF
jgi:hypothetical protein